jgi:UPF0755 protein
MNAKEFLGAISSTIIKIAVAALVIMVVFRLAIYAYDFGFQIFADQPVSSGDGRTVSVVVSNDLSDMELAKLLAQKGLVKDANVFFVQLKLSDDKVVSGVYELNTAMSASEMISAMSDSGDSNEEEED